MHRSAFYDALPDHRFLSISALRWVAGRRCGRIQNWPGGDLQIGASARDLLCNFSSALTSIPALLSYWTASGAMRIKHRAQKSLPPTEGLHWDVFALLLPDEHCQAASVRSLEVAYVRKYRRLKERAYRFDLVLCIEFLTFMHAVLLHCHLLSCKPSSTRPRSCEHPAERTRCFIKVRPIYLSKHQIDKDD